jgi:hypothetical protein
MPQFSCSQNATNTTIALRCGATVDKGMLAYANVRNNHAINPALDLDIAAALHRSTSRKY